MCTAMIRRCLLLALLALLATRAEAAPPEREAVATDPGACAAPLATGAGPAWRPAGPPRFLRLEQPSGGSPAMAVFGVQGCFVADRAQPALALHIHYAPAAGCAAPGPCGGEARVDRLLLPRAEDGRPLPRHVVPLALELRLPARDRGTRPEWTVAGSVSWCDAEVLRACAWADGRPRRPRAGCVEDEATPVLRDLEVRRQPGRVAVRALVGSNFEATLRTAEAEVALLGPGGALLAVASQATPVWSSLYAFPPEGCNPRHWTRLEVALPLAPEAAGHFGGTLLVRFAGAYVLPTDDRRGVARWITGTGLAQAAPPAAARRP